LVLYFRVVRWHGRQIIGFRTHHATEKSALHSVNAAYRSARTVFKDRNARLKLSDSNTGRWVEMFWVRSRFWFSVDREKYCRVTAVNLAYCDQRCRRHCEADRTVA
jgi:hypothetical protein